MAGEVPTTWVELAYRAARAVQADPLPCLLIFWFACVALAIPLRAWRKRRG